MTDQINKDDTNTVITKGDNPNTITINLADFIGDNSNTPAAPVEEASPEEKMDKGDKILRSLQAKEDEEKALGETLLQAAKAHADKIKDLMDRHPCGLGYTIELKRVDKPSVCEKTYADLDLDGSVVAGNFTSAGEREVQQLADSVNDLMRLSN